MNKEIEIPEGYEAKIEGNKVVLIKKESKDEKIRKSLLCFFKHRARPYWNDLNVNDIIAWLENHTEATWTEEDESFVTNILPRILNPYGWTSDQISVDKKYLTEFIERQKRKFTKEQKPAGWIEEDEKMLKALHFAIEYTFGSNRVFGGPNSKDLYNWLKQLKLQPRKKSNLDDEQIIAKWKDLANKYAKKPRLASAIQNAKLELSESDGVKIVLFRVVAENQKDWITANMLSKMEKEFRKLLGNSNVRLAVGVIPEYSFDNYHISPEGAVKSK